MEGGWVNVCRVRWVVGRGGKGMRSGIMPRNGGHATHAACTHLQRAGPPTRADAASVPRLRFSMRPPAQARQRASGEGLPAVAEEPVPSR